jgi:hypothetical protein
MSMGGHDPAASTAENYRAFAEEAAGRSPQYERLSLGVARDAAILDFLAGLPRAKRQPNLLFAAARYLLGVPASIESLRAVVAYRGRELADVMASHRTQTNEPARCATLLPLLAMLPQPLALIEVGASAGLTLLPDRYSYDFAGHRVAGTDPLGPVIACEPRGGVPLPDRVPSVAWRAGLDLNPLDVTSDDDMHWLECLTWPGETGRLARLHAAIATARRDPPAVYQGNLLTDVPSLARQAPADATLVIFHSAVLAYVSPSRRQEFASAVRELGAVWISNEGPGVIPADGGSAAGDGGAGDRGAADASGAASRYGKGCFELIRDGHGLVAFTDGHGAWVHWL